MSSVIAFWIGLKDQLTCPICLDIFNNPRLLSCSHTVCLNCYTNLYNKQQSVKCPVCSVETSSISSELSIDRSSSALVEKYRQSVPQQEQPQLGKCNMSGCHVNAINISPVTSLPTCQKHYDIAMNEFDRLLTDVRVLLSDRVGESGSLKRTMNDVNVAVEEVKKVRDESVEYLHQMVKELKLKMEDLESSSDSRLRCLDDQLNGLKSENDLLMKKQSELNDLLEKKDHENGWKVLKQLEVMLNVTEDCQVLSLKVVPCLKTMTDQLTLQLVECQLVQQDVTYFNEIEPVPSISNTIEKVDKAFVCSDDVEQNNLNDLSNNVYELSMGDVCSEVDQESNDFNDDHESPDEIMSESGEDARHSYHQRRPYRYRYPRHAPIPQFSYPPPPIGYGNQLNQTPFFMPQIPNFAPQRCPNPRGNPRKFRGGRGRRGRSQNRG